MEKNWNVKRHYGSTEEINTQFLVYENDYPEKNNEIIVDDNVNQQLCHCW